MNSIKYFQKQKIQNIPKKQVIYVGYYYYVNLKDFDNAKKYLEKYIAEYPDNKHVADAKRFIANCESKKAFQLYDNQMKKEKEVEIDLE